MRSIKPMLSNMLPLVRSLGQAGSELSPVHLYTSWAQPTHSSALASAYTVPSRMPTSLCGPLRLLTAAGLLPGRPYTMSSLPVNIHQAATFEQLWEPHLFSGTFQLEGPPTTSITQAIPSGSLWVLSRGSPPSPAGLGQREHEACALVTWLD